MRRLTFENSRGESITFYRNPFVIESLTGISESDVVTQGQTSPYQDGERYIDSILQPRYPTLEGAINNTDLKAIKFYRNRVLRVCNPKLGLGKITLELDGDIKEIFAVPDAVPSFPEKGSNVYQRFMIVWKCPDPYWRDPQEVSRALRSYRGKFILPTTFPFELGISGDSTTLYNGGDVDAPVTIDIQGPVTRPRVINKTTGKFVILNRSLSEDEVLHMNTNDQNKRVEIYRGAKTIEKAIGYLDHDSDFWKLEPGDNEIQYIADAGNANAIVAIAWHNHYLGM
ncbi:phage tail family protein [Oceanobacillus kimchii]|uniref:phage tail family protein n=1 Tax=Oceanobacillus kimchii TaxID=746691 RepID=UPI0021A5F351|nr:phage tail family protein [Oceanobacillus kimchii]MCT1575703.1 phage tail family protein [Oceanobacillus kimchii]MCT2137333.1 phage tail family protein [Oceanobacillus kimchii]